MSFSVSFVRQNTGIFTVEKHTIDLNRDTTNETKKKTFRKIVYSSVRNGEKKEPSFVWSKSYSGSENMMHTQIQSNYYFLTGSSIDIYNISPKSLWKKRQQQQQNITLKQTLFILSALLCFESSFILCRFFPLASLSLVRVCVRGFSNELANIIYWFIHV